MTIGDKVLWIRGAVGLTGQVVDVLVISPVYYLLVIDTPLGHFHEHPLN